jgi:hypothetical protein
MPSGSAAWTVRRAPVPWCALSVASGPVIGSLALSGAAGLAGVLPSVALDSSPPTTDPATETTSEAPAGNPEFERNLAELAFALFLGSELDVNAGAYSCTEPASAAVGETITCFTLIGSERVVVAVTELTGISGIYEFVVISDHHIDPVDPAVASTDPQPSTVATTLPVPILVTTTEPLSLADAAILALGEQINEDSDDLVQTLMADDDGFIEQAGYSWDPQSATVTVSATLSPTYTDGVDTAAWIIARDRAMDLWDRQSPFRAEGATIKPGLEIAIDDSRFVSDFDLAVRLADQTIAMTDWLAESRTG